MQVKMDGRIPTELKMDYDPKHHASLMAQLDDVYAGASIVCPNCNKKTMTGRFYFYKDGTGYCNAECYECLSCVPLVSRVKRTDSIKASVVTMESASYSLRNNYGNCKNHGP